jgi:hypothetical protein
MESGNSDSEKRHCMNFHMRQLDVPSCIMEQKAYMKSHFEISVYMISHYDSNGCVKRFSENKWQAKSHPVPGGTYKKIVLKKKGMKILPRDEEMHKVSP